MILRHSFGRMAKMQIRFLEILLRHVAMESHLYQNTYYPVLANSSVFSIVSENTKRFTLSIPEMDVEGAYVCRLSYAFSFLETK